MSLPPSASGNVETVNHTAPAQPSDTVFSFATLFRPRQLPWTIMALIMALILARLGFWQLDRREARLARNNAILARINQPPVQLTGPIDDPATLVYRKALVTGTFDYDHESLLQKTAYGRESGVHILTPLRIDGSEMAVLVDRGWIPVDRSAPEQRTEFRGPQRAAVEGLLRPAATQPVDPAPALNATSGQRGTWSSVDIQGIESRLPYQLLPLYLEQQLPEDAPPLPASVTDLRLDEGSHLGYAVQWFTFALLGLAGYVAVFGRRPRA